MIDELEKLPDISFIDELTVDEIERDLIQLYQEHYTRATGHPAKLEPGMTVTLFLRATAVYFMQILQYVDRAGKLNLLKYTYGPYLDHVAANKSVARLDAQPAETTLRFTVSAPQTQSVSVPAGTRVVGANMLYYATTEYAEIPSGELSVDVPCQCETPGVQGNGLAAGMLTTLVNTLPYIGSVFNISETAGGADVESDDDLKDRVYLAPSQYSTAGPEGAYIYHAKSFSSAIGSVSVDAPETQPGYVYVRFLLKNGDLPNDALVQGMLEHLNDKKIRPLTDRVIVEAPQTQPYDIDLTYYVGRANRDYAVTIQTQVAQAVADYAAWQTSEIGRDINPSALIQRIVDAGAKRVEIRSPQFEIVAPTCVARTAAVMLTYGGVEDD